VIAYTVQLPDTVAAEVDDIAASCEVGKSQIIREIVVDWLISRALRSAVDLDVRNPTIFHYLARTLAARNRTA